MIDVKPKILGSLVLEHIKVLKSIIIDIWKRSSSYSTLKTIESSYLNANGLIRIDEENTLSTSRIVLVSIQVVNRTKKILLSLQLKCVKYFILTIQASQTQTGKSYKDLIIDTYRISLMVRKMFIIS